MLYIYWASEHDDVFPRWDVENLIIVIYRVQFATLELENIKILIAKSAYKRCNLLNSNRYAIIIE